MDPEVIRKIQQAFTYIFITVFIFNIVYEFWVNSPSLRLILSRFALVGILVFLVCCEIIEKPMQRDFKFYYQPYVRGIFQIMISLLFIMHPFNLLDVGVIIMSVLGVI